MKNSLTQLFIVILIQSLVPSLLASNAQCRLILTYDNNHICNKSGGCTINWLQLANRDKFDLMDQSGNPEKTTHQIFLDTGFREETSSFDIDGVLDGHLKKLLKKAETHNQLYIQTVLIGGLEDGTVVFIPSDPIASVNRGLQGRKIHTAYAQAWDRLINLKNYKGFFTLAYLIAESSPGHPIFQNQRLGIEELYSGIIKTQELPIDSPNKVWGLKISKDFSSKNIVVFMYDPGRL